MPRQLRYGLPRGPTLWGQAGQEAQSHRRRPIRLVPPASETGRQAEGEAPRRADGIAREEAAEINHIDDVRKILAVRLEAHVQALRLVNVRADGSAYLKRRKDAVAIKIEAVHDLLTV